MTLAQLKGRKVRARTDLLTGSIDVPKGAVLTISDKRGGLGLEGPRCDVCGIAARLIRVPPGCVELLPLEGTVVPTCCGMQILEDGSLRGQILVRRAKVA